MEGRVVLYICDKAALLLCSDIQVYSGDLCDCESYLSLKCLFLPCWSV